MTGYHYVYILQTELALEHFYVGFTEDLKARLLKHNSGEVPQTAKFDPGGSKQPSPLRIAKELLLSSNISKADPAEHSQKITCNIRGISQTE